MIFSSIATLFFLAMIAAPFLITAIKKRRQVGGLWSGPVSAELHISGNKLSCKHCGYTKFQKREGILATSWVSFFRFSCWNQSAACYTCTRCGHIEWFVRNKEENVEFECDETVC